MMSRECAGNMAFIIDVNISSLSSYKFANSRLKHIVKDHMC